MVEVVLQSPVVGAQRLVGDGQVTVRGSLRRPIVHLQQQRSARSLFLATPPAPAPDRGTHLQGYLQLLPVVPDGLVVDAEGVVRVAHVSERPPLSRVIAQLLREGQVSFVVLQRRLVLPLHLVYDAWEGEGTLFHNKAKVTGDRGGGLLQQQLWKFQTRIMEASNWLFTLFLAR